MTAARRRMLWWRIGRALRVLALRRRLSSAEELERQRFEEYLAQEEADAIAWRDDPFPASSYPELAADPEAHAIAVRLHRQLAGEWHVPEARR